MNDPPLKGWERLRELVSQFAKQNADGSYSDIFGAEIGVSMGWTSERLLYAFPRLYLTMVDYWDAAAEESDYAKSGDGHAALSLQQQTEHRCKAEERTVFAAERRTILAMDSVEAARTVADGALDFAFIDASHVYQDVRIDAKVWWPKLRQDGLLIFHDLDHPRDKRGIWGVRRAAEECARRTGCNLTVDSKATIGWIHKGC